LSIIAFGNHGFPHAIKSIREEENSLALRQFYFVFRINFILFGGTQREGGAIKVKSKTSQQAA
jgi:hypothetical protein